VADGRWLMADGRWLIAVDPSPLPYRQTAFPVYFAVSIPIHFYSLSIIIYLSCSSLLKITTEIERDNTNEKAKVRVKDNQLFHRLESSLLKSRQLWLGSAIL
jgi:hypothetical protein